MNYNHKEIEAKWQKIWEDQKLYHIKNNGHKYYVLDMFPYPSGAGLHVGHPKGYIATDILARYKMLNGFSVLHPMGWDAFGLPAENDALKNKTHPQISTENNIKNYKRQMQMLGLSYDWSREINTTDPNYYKWTQWAFLQMFKKGLVYESNEPINWCPSCKTGLANEDLEDGKCERCGSIVERKPIRQIMIRITDYADRLLADLKLLPDWDESVKDMQKNWIGKSEGAEVIFKIKDTAENLEVFTTRPDTLYGCTYMVVCPEHELITKLKDRIENYNEIEEYQHKAKSKSDLERTDLNKDKTGVETKGIKAINPVNNKELPIFVADYVLTGYGTGAIMAVPAHDERDFEFATKYGLEIKQVVVPVNSNLLEQQQLNKQVFTGSGKSINSELINGLETSEAQEKILDWLSKNKLGEQAINYRLRDWVFSRQRYWGEPIPLLHCDKCGLVGVPESELPVKLPAVENYEPSGTGESPLSNISDWVNTTCPKCSGPAKRETNTMPQWAGSCWYYLRYMDPQNDKALVDKSVEKFWSPIDHYVGGAEHVTRHMIYARFWHKFLYDLGVVSIKEPFTKYSKVGLILAKDGRKMSKRWNNVINPDDIIEQYGADALRIYEMFMGPFEQAIAWNTNGLVGTSNFLKKVASLMSKVQDEYNDEVEVINLTHKMIKKVGNDIQEFKFNTAVSALMILANKFADQEQVSKNLYENFLLILSPLAPHLTEELWHQLGHEDSIFKASWPKYDEEKIFDQQIKLVVQVNGKLRDTIEVVSNINEADAKALAMNSANVKKWLAGAEISQVIFVKGRLINFVLK
ncbi:MAG: leucine--tRNA ligase [bacterium]